MLQPPVLRALGLRPQAPAGPAGACPRFRRAARARGGCAAPRWTRSATRTCAGSSGALVGEYRAAGARALRRLAPGHAPTPWSSIAELPDLVRGYEDIKLAGVAAFRAKAAEALAELPA